MSARTTAPVSWVTGPPTLATPALTLKEPDALDAEPLWRHLATEEVGRWMSDAPPTSDGFRRFFEWVRRERAAGRGICYAIRSAGQREPVGLIQARSIEPGFGVAEWGFAIGRSYWGTGLFLEAARTFGDFLFHRVGVQRLEARAAVSNGRGAGALMKLGAEPEGILRRAFERRGERFDQVLWAINREPWLSRFVQPIGVVEPSELRDDIPGTGEPRRSRGEWTEGLPMLAGDGCVLRELMEEDAPLLAGLLSAPAVTRFLAPPPNGVPGFQQFVKWTRLQREAGRSAAFGIVPTGMDRAVGFLQLHSVNHGLGIAEWGFALGEPYWGSGLFRAGAELMLQFTFETLKVRRLEARAAVNNDRGNGALRKLGATAECRLRRSFLIDDRCHDDMLWSLLDDEWRSRSVRHVRDATSTPATTASRSPESPTERDAAEPTNL